jgi:hypothetical protein
MADGGRRHWETTLPGSSEARPRWSRDGRFITFNTQSGAVRVPLSGGDIIALSEDNVDEINRWLR